MTQYCCGTVTVTETKKFLGDIAFSYILLPHHYDHHLHHSLRRIEHISRELTVDIHHTLEHVWLG
eukprot:6337950-Ditylum_brightwellii.AAC.1